MCFFEEIKKYDLKIGSIYSTSVIHESKEIRIQHMRTENQKLIRIFI